MATLRWLGLVILVTSCVVHEAPPPQPPTDDGASRAAVDADAGTQAVDDQRFTEAPPAPIDVAVLAPASLRSVARPKEVKNWSGHNDLVPFQQWPVLGTTTIGLLYQSGPQAWGPTLNHTRGITNNPARIEYAYTTAGSSPFALYFQSRGEGENFLANWGVPTPDGKAFRSSAAMFTAATPNRWGLSRPAHLVELEVNGGAGGGNGVHFIVTNARVRTDLVSWEPTETLVALRGMFDAFSKSLAPKMAKAHVAPPRFESAAMFPSFDPVRNELNVVFVGRQNSQRDIGPVVEGYTDCPVCPCDENGCAPCVRCNPQPVARQVVEATDIEWAVRYTVAADGTLTNEERFLPKITTKKQHEERPLERTGRDLGALP